MATWALADGTVLSTGGSITGASELAEALRTDVRRRKLGYEVTVWLGAPPGSSAVLDLSDDWHLDCWVRTEASRHGVELTSAPELEQPEGLRSESSGKPRTIY